MKADKSKQNCNHLDPQDFTVSVVRQVIIEIKNPLAGNSFIWRAVKIQPWMKRDIDVLQLVYFIDYIIQVVLFIN